MGEPTDQFEVLTRDEIRARWDAGRRPSDELARYVRNAAEWTGRMSWFEIEYTWSSLRELTGSVPPDVLLAGLRDPRIEIRCDALRNVYSAPYLTQELRDEIVGIGMDEAELGGILSAMLASYDQFLNSKVGPREVRFRRAAEARRGRVWRYGKVEWKILARMRAVLSGEISLLADPPPLGAEIAVPASELQRAVEAATELLASDASMVPTVFGLLIDEPVVERKDGIWSPPGLRASLDSEGWDTQVWNVLLEGDPGPWMAVTGGYDRCQLERRTESGAEEVRDLRGLKEFRTANWGVIRILSRPEEHTLTRTLRSMRAYLKACGDGEVLKSGR